MKRNDFFKAGATSLKGIFSKLETPAQITPNWEAFDQADLVAKQAESGRPWLPFLTLPTLKTGLYVLKAGSTDPQKPHNLDEVYYVIKGKAKFEVDGSTTEANPGTILFVKAFVPHRFYEIIEDIEILVFFSEVRTEKK